MYFTLETKQDNSKIEILLFAISHMKRLSLRCPKRFDFLGATIGGKYETLQYINKFAEITKLKFSRFGFSIIQAGGIAFIVL